MGDCLREKSFRAPRTLTMRDCFNVAEETSFTMAKWLERYQCIFGVRVLSRRAIRALVCAKIKDAANKSYRLIKIYRAPTTCTAWIFPPEVRTSSSRHLPGKAQSKVVPRARPRRHRTVAVIDYLFCSDLLPSVANWRRINTASTDKPIKREHPREYFKRKNLASLNLNSTSPQCLRTIT